ncbi:MAG: MFS transporter [Candidatus Lokiarchaeota archaeon]|nr:MFS transporter [Candidatus Lokiarchaeota archaeon]MBD3201792.1 MFS transporter [Candidatus Lokiarchaeota archaeon]
MEETNQNSTTKTNYFRYLVIMLIFVQIIDSYTTSFPTLVPSNFIDEFLFGFPQNIAAAIFAFVTALASIGMYFCALNTYLSDKFGRMKMLAVTVFGMVLVAILINFSQSIIDFTIYLLLLWFFTRSDIWMIFIGEESPKSKRAFWTNIILVFGLSGAILAPILRSRFITETSSNWRGLTWFIIILGIPLGLLILFTLKEPKIYDEMREETKSKERIITIRQNVSNLIKSQNKKEIIASLVISFLLGANSIFRNLVEEAASQSLYMVEDQISLIILAGVIAVYIAVFLIGGLADKIGRLPLLYIFTILIPIARLIFALVVYQPFATFPLTALSVGLSEMGYWGAWITISIVILEIIPTETRGTGAGLKSLAGAFGITLGFLSASLISFFLDLAWAFVILGFLTVFIIPLVYTYLNETRNVDLKEISKLKN